jgi:hypothetical protein
LKRLNISLLTSTDSFGIRKGTLSGDKVIRLANVNNTFTYIHEPRDSWIKCFTANCKAFGPISRDRHFRFLIKWITFFGLSERDFRNALRIRDLWLRGTRAYRGAIINFNCALPKELREFVRCLPLKETSKIRRNPRFARGFKPKSRY